MKRMISQGSCEHVGPSRVSEDDHRVVVPGEHPTLKKGSWTDEEDKLLLTHVRKYSEGKWNICTQAWRDTHKLMRRKRISKSLRPCLEKSGQKSRTGKFCLSSLKFLLSSEHLFVHDFSCYLLFLSEIFQIWSYFSRYWLSLPINLSCS